MHRFVVVTLVELLDVEVLFSFEVCSLMKSWLFGGNLGKLQLFWRKFVV